MRILQFLAVLAISLLCFTGCDDEVITNYAFQDISAPENVTADFAVTQDDTGTVTITPSGDGASIFQVYFGDVENETATEIAAGESITHVYPEGEYMVRVVAVGASGLTSEFNQRLVISFREPKNLVVNIDQPDSDPTTIGVSATADFATSFDVYFGDVENEEPTQLMPDETINHKYTEAGVYLMRVVAKGAGVATSETSLIITIPEPSDPLKLPITFDDPLVNYAAIGTFGGTEFELVMNPDVSGANSEETMVGKLTNSGSEWEGVVFELGEPVDFSGSNKVVQMNMWSDVEISVLLKFEGGIDDARANEVKVTHPGTGWVNLSFDFGADAVKSFIDGDPENGTSFIPTGMYEKMVIFVDGGGFTAGNFYFDNIEFNSMNAAPSPTDAPEDVRSIFSDEYDDPTGVNYFPNWGQTTTFQLVSINGNEAIKYGNANYQGIDIGESIDATAYNTVKIDVYSGDYTSIPFFLISSSGEKSVSLDLTPGQWNTIEIPLTDFTSQGLDISDVFQFKFDVQPDNGGTFFIDNLYFSKNEVILKDPTGAAPVPGEAEADVISIFSDSYADPSGVNYYPDWGQSTTFEEVSLEGNNAIKYSNANYQGIDIGEAIDASAYTTVHIDVWSGDYTSIPFFLISSSGEKSVNLNVTPNQWNSIEIPLSEFTDQGLDISDVFQFKFDVQPNTGGTFYIDNLYFHN